eukprot:Em0479g1a
MLKYHDFNWPALFETSTNGREGEHHHGHKRKLSSDKQARDLSLPSERAPQTHRKRLEDDDIIMSEVELDKDMFQKVLVEIGDHIQECIKSYGDGVMEKPQKLYKIYKKARKERGKEDMPVKRHYLESSEQGSMEAYGGWGQEAVSSVARFEQIAEFAPETIILGSTK